MQEFTESGPIALADGQGGGGCFQNHGRGIGLADAVQGDDVGTVDAHELVGGKFLYQALEAVQDDERVRLAVQVDFHVLAHALNVADIGQLDRYGFVVRLETDGGGGFLLHLHRGVRLGGDRR